jgi:hypothetical protein
MKLIKFLLFLSIVIGLASSRSLLTRHDTTQARTQARNYVDFARVAYCVQNGSVNSSCAVCHSLERRGFKIVHVESQIKDNIQFTMVVSASQSGEIVISFGGPKAQNVAYLQQIYASGMSQIPELNNLTVENEFWNVYSSFFLQSLHNYLSNLSGQYQKIVFVGHSFGGSLAIISSYDLVQSGIISKEQSQLLVFTYGALKIGDHQFINTVQYHTDSPIVRIRKGIDFFTLIPRCVFISHLNVWHCYRNYVYLVRAFPMFAYYYSRYSHFIRNQLVTSLPQIMNNAQSYINKQVIQGGSHHHLNSHGHEEKNNINKPQVDPQQIIGKENTQRHTKLNDVLSQNQNKPIDHNFIKQVSDVFNHDKKIEDNKSQPNQSVTIGNSLDTSKLKKNSQVTQQRLANHDPLPYSGTQNIDTNLSPNKDSVETKAHRALEEEELRKRNIQHSPVAYSGLHSESLANSHSHLGHSSGSSSHRTPHHHNHHDLRKRNKRIFLETESMVENKVQERNTNIFKDCETHSHYVSCRFSTEIHQFFFGVNIESCE